MDALSNFHSAAAGPGVSHVLVDVEKKLCGALEMQHLIMIESTSTTTFFMNCAEHKRLARPLVSCKDNHDSM